MSILSRFDIPISWSALLKRTGMALGTDNGLGLSAQLAYYFFLALFPALLFMVALISFLPFGDVMSTMMATLGRVAPAEVLTIISDQLAKITASNSSGLLTLGAAGALWTTSSGVTAIIDALNQTYNIRDARPWWKVRLLALALTLALALFTIVAFVLVVAGPALATKVADWFHLGLAFRWTWLVMQWPVVFLIIALAVAIIYYYGPDAEQEWEWITPGSVLATLLWLLVSLGFRFYITNFGSYNATYGTIGGVIVLLLWFYFSGLALLVGATLNAEAEHASPHGKDPGEKKPGEKRKIGRLAERLWRVRHAGASGGAGAHALPVVVPPVPAVAFSAAPEALGETNCARERVLPPASVTSPTARPSDWLLSGVVLAEAAVLTYLKLRPRFKRVRP